MRLMADAARGERGAVMLFVLMAVLLVGAVTISVMRVISSDAGGGMESLEADQVFNIAQAGVHYAIGKLSLSTGSTYAGETRAITTGSTKLGTATITVNCVDTTSVNNWTPPCASSAYPGNRRIISTGSLPVSGPSRTIVAVVQGTSPASGVWPYAFCATSSVTDTTNDPGTDAAVISADIASNGSINMTPAVGSGTTVSITAGATWTGKISAGTTASCGTGCAAAGGVLANQGTGQCKAPTLPTFTAGATNVTVAAGTTYTIPQTGGNYGAVSLTTNNGSGATPCQANKFTTLAIQTDPLNSSAVTTVNMNTLYMDSCTRLQILGVGQVNLLLDDPHAEALHTVGHMTGGAQPTHFGVGPADTYSTPQPIAASRLTVYINSDGASGTDCDTVPGVSGCAGFLMHATGGATFVAPNGTFQVDDDASTCALGSGCSSGDQGAIFAKDLLLSDKVNWNSDMSGASVIGTPTYSNFTQLLSWKDQ